MKNVEHDLQTTVTVGYSQTKDKLNSTRNNNMFNIGVRVSM